MRSRRILFTVTPVALWVILYATGTSHADVPGYVHVVKKGDTLPSIAQQFYGDARMVTVLAVENGIPTVATNNVVAGMRISIPWAASLQAKKGDSWSSLAKHFYADESRGFAIWEANNASGKQRIDPGTQLLIPYPLRHLADGSTSFRELCKKYYQDDSFSKVRFLRKFNRMRGKKPAASKVVLVPLANLVLSEEGRAVVQRASGRDLVNPEGRKRQQSIKEGIPALAVYNRMGKYAEAVAHGNRLLGTARPTSSQRVAIQRQLAVAYVALGRSDLAKRAFIEALKEQPLLELDKVKTSPKVIDAFQQARARGKKSRGFVEDPDKTKKP